MTTPHKEAIEWAATHIANFLEDHYFVEREPAKRAAWTMSELTGILWIVKITKIGGKAKFWVIRHRSLAT